MDVKKEEGNLDHKARTRHMESDMKMGRLGEEGVVVGGGGNVHEGRHAPLVRRLFLFLLFPCRLVREVGSPPDREVDKDHKERS